MPKPVVKITVLMAHPEDHSPLQGFGDLTNFITCEISSVDKTWHGLKELERAGIFTKLRDSMRLRDAIFKFVAGDSLLSRAFNNNQPLSPNVKLYSFEKKKSPKEIKKQLKSIDFKFDGKITLQQLKDFFDKLGFTAIISGEYSAPDVPSTVTLQDYAYKIGDKWYEKVEAEHQTQRKIKDDTAAGNFPDIETYIGNNPDFFSGGEEKESDWEKSRAQRLTKSNPGQEGFDLFLRGRDAIEHAISDAINRMETFDANGNLERCPITLEPFEAHNKVILIMSRQSDGSLQASFVKRESHEGKKVIDNLPYIKQLKKNPENNNPVVALEVGTLNDFKSKYRKNTPLRPPL